MNHSLSFLAFIIYYVVFPLYTKFLHFFNSPLNSIGVANIIDQEFVFFPFQNESHDVTFQAINGTKLFHGIFRSILIKYASNCSEHFEFNNCLNVLWRLRNRLKKSFTAHDIYVVHFSVFANDAKWLRVINHAVGKCAIVHLGNATSLVSGRFWGHGRAEDAPIWHGDSCLNEKTCFFASWQKSF